MSLVREKIEAKAYVADYYLPGTKTPRPRKEYYAENFMLMRQFQSDLAAENGLTDHPKADLLFAKAWEHGHSSGLMDVVHWYEDLADLLS